MARREPGHVRTVSATNTGQSVWEAAGVAAGRWERAHDCVSDARMVEPEAD